MYCIQFWKLALMRYSKSISVRASENTSSLYATCTCGKFISMRYLSTGKGSVFLPRYSFLLKIGLIVINFDLFWTLTKSFWTAFNFFLEQWNVYDAIHILKRHKVFFKRFKVDQSDIKLVLLVSKSLFLEYLSYLIDYLLRFSFVIMDLFLEVATDILPLI